MPPLLDAAKGVVVEGNLFTSDGWLGCLHAATALETWAERQLSCFECARVVAQGWKAGTRDAEACRLIVVARYGVSTATMAVADDLI